MTRTIITALAQYFTLGMLPLLTMIAANYIVEPQRAWLTNTTTTQDVAAYTILIAWMTFALKVTIAPLEKNNAKV